MELVAPAVVDVHNHIVCEDVVAFLAREGAPLDTRIETRGEGRFARIGTQAVRPLHARMCDPRARLADMDRLAIDVQAVSCTPFVLYADAPPDLALAVAQVNNDSLAALARHHPSRFAPLASVPLQSPEPAARELERAHALGLRGVEIPARAGALDLDDARLEPFWAAAESLAMPVCVHPFEASPHGALARYALSPLVGNLFDTGLAATLLVMGGVFDRHPRLRIVLYHGGGAFPALLARLQAGYERIPEARSAASRPPSQYLDRFWFDTVTFDLGWLRQLVTRFGAGQFVLGSDYPLPLGPSDPAAEVRALGLDPGSEAAILGGNARGLLGLPMRTERAA
ncbi:MAG TPA: amidohydrolase family protein [Myxococcota bacterium]|nr:amidohydrolase family protein [Myxococcota bacterium]